MKLERKSKLLPFVLLAILLFLSIFIVFNYNNLELLDEDNNALNQTDNNNNETETPEEELPEEPEDNPAPEQGGNSGAPTETSFNQPTNSMESNL